MSIIMVLVISLSAIVALSAMAWLRNHPPKGVVPWYGRRVKPPVSTEALAYLARYIRESNYEWQSEPGTHICTGTLRQGNEQFRIICDPELLRLTCTQETPYHSREVEMSPVPLHTLLMISAAIQSQSPSSPG